MEPEIWKEIPGFGGHYEASSMGNIRTKARDVVKRHRSGKTVVQHYRERVLRPARSDRWGHLTVTLGFDGIKVSPAVHRLVLLAFHGPAPEGCEGCHNNGNPADNRPENLRWDTHHNNNQDRKAHGNYAKGADHPMAKFSLSCVTGIRDGSIPRKVALAEYGVSSSQFHRIKKNLSWVGL